MLKILFKKAMTQARILQLVAKRSDVPWYAKALVFVAVGYVFSHIDLIPDFIPFLGLIDDLVILPLLVYLAFKLVPKHIRKECSLQIEEKKDQ